MGHDWAGDFVDDDEFLVAPDYGDPVVEEPDLVDVEFLDDEEAEQSGGGWDPSRGFPDGRRAVRVWADDEGILQDVRVSLRWREKLRGSSLEAGFATAFMAMNAIYHTGAHPLPVLEPVECDVFAGRKAGWEMLRVAHREWARVEAELAGLGDVPPTRWVGEQVSGSTFGGDVVVTLGIFGQPIAVVFDDEWLRGAVRVSEISRGVLGAYRRARKKYRPPHVEYGERELLSREHEGISAALLRSFEAGLDA